jgi:predicted RNA polymerase sigma factor
MFLHIILLNVRGLQVTNAVHSVASNESESIEAEPAQPACAPAREVFRAGRLAEARSEFEASAKLTRNAREAAFLLARADACG